MMKLVVIILVLVTIMMIMVMTMMMIMVMIIMIMVMIVVLFELIWKAVRVVVGWCEYTDNDVDDDDKNDDDNDDDGIYGSDLVMIRRIRMIIEQLVMMQESDLLYLEGINSQIPQIITFSSFMISKV